MSEQKLDSVIVAPGEVERFRHHITLTIKGGKETAEILKSKMSKSGEIPADYVEESEHEIRIGELAQLVTFDGHEDNPSHDPEFVGPVEVLKEMAFEMAYDYCEKASLDEPSIVGVRAARQHLDKAEGWLEVVESLAVSEAVAA